MKDIKIYKAHIIFTKTIKELTIIGNGYLAEANGKIVGVFHDLPSEYANCQIIDFGDKLMLPGFIDMHTHAAQFENLGLGLDKELLPWLNTYTFPEESKFCDEHYATQVYSKFANQLMANGTTRVVVFASIHKQGTKILMDILESVGIGAFVGKVNMDRNSPESLTESTEDSLAISEEILKESRTKYSIVRPIITPRFTPSCSDQLLYGLGRLSAKYNVPVQSHLSENVNEVKWVQELAPASKTYADSYLRYGLLGQQPTIMAHCVYNTDEEIEMLKDNGVFVAHCPMSNLDLCSGIAPVRKLIDKGVKVCLGTDISGGHSLSMLSAITAAIQSSKIFNVYVDPSAMPLTLNEAFYMATKAGGEFFGKVGSFEEGFEFDCIVIDDNTTHSPDYNVLSIKERLEKFIYNGSHQNIVKVISAGREIL